MYAAEVCLSGLDSCLESLMLPVSIKEPTNKVLEKFIGRFVLVFIDDIVIYSKTEKEHEEHMRLVLEALEAPSLTLKD